MFTMFLLFCLIEIRWAGLGAIVLVPNSINLATLWVLPKFRRLQLETLKNSPRRDFPVKFAHDSPGTEATCRLPLIRYTRPKRGLCRIFFDAVDFSFLPTIYQPRLNSRSVALCIPFISVNILLVLASVLMPIIKPN